MNIVISIPSLVASYQWKIHQMDVKNVSLNGNIHEDIYMQKQPGLITNDTSSYYVN